MIPRSVHILAFFVLTISLGGCGTTSGVGYPGFGTKVYKVDTDGSGGVIWSHFTDHSEEKVKLVASFYCQQKQLITTRLTLESIGSLFSSSEFYKYSFRCGAPVPVAPVNLGIPKMLDPPLENKSQNLPKVQDVDSKLDQAKSKCAALGFKAGTEKFGDCVIQLSR